MKSLRLISQALLCLIFLACNDSGSSGLPNIDSTISLKLTDTSVKDQNIESVELNISKVEARRNGEFITLFEDSTTIDVYGLDGANKLELANVPVKAGVIDEVRVIVDSGVVHMSDGNYFEMKIPSGASSGVKLKLTPTLDIIKGGVPYELVLDFDLSQSLTPLLSGADVITGYRMDPVIRLVNKSYHGDIKGMLYSDMCTGDIIDDEPLGKKLVLAMRNGEIVAVTESHDNGEFYLIGLAPGDYEILLESELHKSMTVEREVSAVADANVSARMAGKCAKIKGTVFEELPSGGVYAIEDAIVRLYDINGSMLEESYTDGNGQFSFSARFEDDYDLEIISDSHEIKTQRVSIDEVYMPVKVALTAL